MNTSSSTTPVGNRRKERLRDRQERYIAKFKEDPNKPSLQSLLRGLYRRAHPDVIRHSEPDLADVNNSSMQVLNGVLSTLKVANSFPPRLSQHIPFHVKSGDTIVKYELKLVTAGGDSRRQLTTSFVEFFREAGILEGKEFAWDKEYYPEGVEEASE
jgi:hypothetical protein